MNVEVLVACMQQKDDSLYEKMNLRTDAVFANQCDEYSYKTIMKGDKKLRIVSTSDRGVGKNRNMALLNATGDILLFSDEDMVYCDDYEIKIKTAFEKLPHADAIIFNCSFSNNGIIYKTSCEKTKRVRIYNALKYGTCRIAIKRESFLRANIYFSQLYGGGARYSSGEDSLFIVDMLKKKLKVYTHEFVIGYTAEDVSSWFNGYTNKYYFDKGVWLANAFPVMKYPLGMYYAFKLRNTSERSVMQVFSLISEGIKNFKVFKIS